MRNILKEKNIKNDIIEASISSHIGDDYLDLFKKLSNSACPFCVSTASG